MEIVDPYTITIRFAQPFVTFGNRVTQGLFASSAFIHSKSYRDQVGDEGVGVTGRPRSTSRQSESIYMRNVIAPQTGKIGSLMSKWGKNGDMPRA